MEERVQVLVRTLRLRPEAPIGSHLPARIADVLVAGAGVIGSYRLPRGPAQHLVERLVHYPGVVVPERDVEGGDGARLDARAAPAEVIRQAARQALDLQR